MNKSVTQNDDQHLRRFEDVQFNLENSLFIIQMKRYLNLKTKNFGKPIIIVKYNWILYTVKNPSSLCLRKQWSFIGNV